MKFIELVHQFIFKLKYRKNISNPSEMTGVKGIKIGKETVIGSFCILKANRGNIQGEIILGEDVYIGGNTHILGGSGIVKIGNHVRTGNNLVLLGGGNISIGNNSLLSHNIVISSSSHNLQNKDIMANETPSIFKPIIIEENVFIGANTTILMGTTIGKGSIIGAASLVLENTIIGKDEVWVGNPANKIYTRKSLKEQIEEEIVYFLKKYPFHNLFFLYELHDIEASKYGGTCSDRTIKFKKKLDEKFKCLNVEFQLHRASINNKETHTILRVKVNDEIYFCDVGMGFPIVKLLPSSYDIKFNAYGIQFRTINSLNEIIVYINEGTKEKELMRINKEAQSQKKIENEIARRWEFKESLPFNNRLRYFFIHKNKYYQIKDNDLSFNSKAIRIFEEK